MAKSSMQIQAITLITRKLDTKAHNLQIYQNKKENNLL